MNQSAQFIGLHTPAPQYQRCSPFLKKTILFLINFAIMTLCLMTFTKMTFCCHNPLMNINFPSYIYKFPQISKTQYMDYDWELATKQAFIRSELIKLISFSHSATYWFHRWGTEKSSCVTVRIPTSHIKTHYKLMPQFRKCNNMHFHFMHIYKLMRLQIKVSLTRSSI